MISRGTSLSSFPLDVAQRNAEEVLQEREQIVLSAKDWEQFAEILDDDSPPNETLRAAARKFRANQ